MWKMDTADILYETIYQMLKLYIQLKEKSLERIKQKMEYNRKCKIHSNIAVIMQRRYFFIKQSAWSNGHSFRLI